jgi:hypothetical protein
VLDDGLCDLALIEVELGLGTPANNENVVVRSTEQLRKIEQQ